MEFEEFFENKRKHQRNFREHGYREDHPYSYDTHHSYPEHDNHQKWLTILDKIRSNKRLKVIAVLAVVLVISIAILLLFVFLPLIMKLINFILQNGLQGILDAITGFLDKLWKGLGK